MSGCLVWITGMRGPEPQKWMTRDQKREPTAPKVLAIHDLKPGEFDLPFAILEQRYPPPPQEPL